MSKSTKKASASKPIKKESNKKVPSKPVKRGGSKTSKVTKITPKKPEKKQSSSSVSLDNSNEEISEEILKKIIQSKSESSSSSDSDLVEPESDLGLTREEFFKKYPEKLPKKPVKKCNKKSSSQSEDEDKPIKIVIKDENKVITRYDKKITNQKLEEFLFQCNHNTAAELAVCIIEEHELISDSYNISKSKTDSIFYQYDTQEGVYKQISSDQTKMLVMKRLIEFLKKAKTNYLQAMVLRNAVCKKQINAKLNNECKQIEKVFDNCINRVSNINLINDIIKVLKNHKDIYQKGISDKFDSLGNIANFKNGYVDLRNGQFFKRRQELYITKYLPYDYSKESNKDITREIEKIILRICNDDEDLAEGYKAWLGYCLTGETKETKCMWSIGHSASNGKTTIVNAFHSMYSIYSKEINPSTYDKKNTKAHKTFANLKGYRYVSLNEIDQSKLDIQLLKDHIDGGIVAGNEVLYGTTEDIPISFKLQFTGNNDPNFKTDNGMKRRGWCINHTNQFFDLEKCEKHKAKQGIYPRDVNLKEKFERDTYKLAFFNILLPYAIRYYNTRFNEANMKSFEKRWSSICGENDNMKSFIRHKYDMEPDSYIHKEEFIKQYRRHFQLNNTNWNVILNDIKRLGIKYDSMKMVDGKRGQIVGLKLKNIEDD